MAKQTNKKLFEELLYHLAMANKITEELSKSLGYSEVSAPKKETIRMKAKRNVAIQFANMAKKAKKQSV